MGLHYEKAVNYVNNDDFKNAIEECKIGIQNSDFDCAYELGLIYSELLDKKNIDIKKAIESFEIGAKNGHKECQKELGEIFLANPKLKNYHMAIKWLLFSEKYEKKLDELREAIKIIYKNTDLNDITSLKLVINNFNEYIRLTKNKKILELVDKYRNVLVYECGKLVVKRSKTIDELNKNYNYFLEYVDKDFFCNILSYFGKKEVSLFLESCNDVDEAKTYLLSLDNKNYKYDIQSRELIYLWLANSYCCGLNNAAKDINLSIKYCKNVTNSTAKSELEKKINLEKARIQKGLIFDLDGTVFDTNCIRAERRRVGPNHISKEILKTIQLIKGFESLFLNENSKLYLKNNKILFITNSSETYAKTLLKLYCLDDFECHCACGTKDNPSKSEWIVDFVKRSGLKNFIAFGDEEKDAQLYSQCGIPFYLVNKNYGYDNNVQELMENVIIPNKEDFRNKFMYDVIDLKKKFKKKKFDFDTKYFDDFIVYYCRYYDKNKYNFGRCPSMSGRNYFKKITCSEFKNKKGEYVRSHLSDLMEKDYKNIGISLPKNAVFVKIPGHNETSYNPNSPCSILIKELCQKYGKERDYSDFLIRSSVVRNHDSGRDINDHVKTIIPIKTKKITGKIVYLFDDVCTTGIQMSVCIDKLYKAGAGHVVCFCICRTCPRNNYKLDEIEGGSR